MKLKVRLRTSEDVSWEGEADTVSSVNSQGVFDILPNHAQMVTLIEGHPILIRNGGEQKKVEFSRAVLHVHENLVSIYAAD
jgi:F0F1-type ATP synthase epsilon subunit